MNECQQFSLRHCVRVVHSAIWAQFAKRQSSLAFAYCEALSNRQELSLRSSFCCRSPRVEVLPLSLCCTYGLCFPLSLTSSLYLQPRRLQGTPRDTALEPLPGMKASAELSAEHHEAVMLPMGTEFDRLLRIMVRTAEFDDEGEIEEHEHDAVLRVPCSKPAQSNVPSAEDLLRLAPYERALKEVLDAQQLRFDAEALTKVCVLLLRRSRTCRADKVDLSNDTLRKLPVVRGR